MVRVSRGWSEQVIYCFRLRVERRAAWSGREREADLVELIGAADAALDQVLGAAGGRGSQCYGRRANLCQVAVLAQLAAARR